MALSLAGTGGMQMVSQINFRLGTRGVVTGANIMNMQMNKLEKTARRTAAGMAGVKKGMEDIGTVATKASAALAGYGFGLTMLGKKITDNFTKKSIESAADFEVAMERIRFATNATASEMQMLQRVMIKTGKDTVETPTSAANAFADLRASGIKTKEALELLPMTIQMVTGSRGILGMDQAIRLAVSAITKFKHTGQPFKKTMDDIAQATRETALNWQHMPAFFNALRAAPMKLRATSGEILALGGIIKKGGAQAAEAGQAIGIFTTKMIENSRRLRLFARKKGVTEEEFLGMDVKKLPLRLAQFQQFGKSIKMFTDTGKLKPVKKMLADILIQMEKLMKAGDEEGLTALSGAFGDKAGTMVLMLENLRDKNISVEESLSKLFKTFENTEGTLERAEKAFLKTARGVEKLAEGSKQTILMLFGKTLLPIIDLVARKILNLMNKFLDFLDANEKFAKALAITITAFGILTMVIGVLAIAAAGAIFYTKVLAVAIAEVGGVAGVAALGLGAFKTALITIGWTALGLVAIFGLIYLAMENWESIVEWFSGPLSKSIITFFKDMKLVAMGLVEWWDGEGGPNSMKLFEQLDERHLTGFVGFLLQTKYKIVEFFKGVWEGFKIGLKAIGTFITIITTAISYVVDLLGFLPKLFHTEDLTDNIKVYEYWGKVIGVVASTALFLYTMVLAGAGVKALMTMGRAITLVATKTFLLKFATVALVAAYFALLYVLTKVGAKLGELAFVAVENLKIGFREMQYELMLVGEGIVMWLKEGFSNGWGGFVDWAIAQVEFLATKALSVFGMKSQEEVDAAWAKATKGAFDERDKTQRRQDIIMYGEDYVNQRDEQRKLIAERAALSRAGVGEGKPQMSGVAGPEPWEREGALATAQSMQPRTQTINVTIQGNATKEDAEKIAREFGYRANQFMDNEWEIAYK